MRTLILFFLTVGLCALLGPYWCRNVESSTSWPREIHVEIQPDPLLQPQRKMFIDRCINEQIFRRIVPAGKTVRIYVDWRFYVADFENKQKFVAIVLEYYNVESNADVIRLIDVKTNETVGSMSTFFPGYALDLD